MKLFQRNGEDAMKGVTPAQLSAAFDKAGSSILEEYYEWVPPDAKPGAGEALV